jgi:hypothetical protein
MPSSLPLILLTTLATNAGPVAQPTRLPAHLVEPPTLSLDLSPYAGLGVLLDGTSSTSFALAGGMLRVRILSIQLGGYADIATLPNEYMESWGGLVGAHLPFFNWVDVDTALGLGVRAYSNYGEASYLGDYRVSGPAGTARLGISDRAGQLLGVRVGAQLIAGLDFSRKEQEWRIEPNERNLLGSSGVRQFGGLTLALVISFGLDVLPGYEAPPEPSRTQRVPAL